MMMKMMMIHTYLPTYLPIYLPTYLPSKYLPPYLSTSLSKISLCLHIYLLVKRQKHLKEIKISQISTAFETKTQYTEMSIFVCQSQGFFSEMLLLTICLSTPYFHQKQLDCYKLSSNQLYNNDSILNRWSISTVSRCYWLKSWIRY